MTIYWLGGSPCAGKSSVAQRLAAEYNIGLYQVDVEFERHAAYFTAAAQPALTTWLQGDCRGRWLKPTPALLADAVACYTEHFAFILRDVQQRVAADGATQLLVEGTALLPELVLPLLSDVHHAYWLTPTADFQITHYRRRAWIKAALANCADAEQAFANWMARDSTFADLVVTKTKQLGLQSAITDHTRTVAAQAYELAAWYGWHTSKGGDSS